MRAMMRSPTSLSRPEGIRDCSSAATPARRAAHVLIRDRCSITVSRGGRVREPSWLTCVTVCGGSLIAADQNHSPEAAMANRPEPTPATPAHAIALRRPILSLPLT